MVAWLRTLGDSQPALPSASDIDAEKKALGIEDEVPAEEAETVEDQVPAEEDTSE